MPYGEDFLSDRDMSPPLIPIKSDLFRSFETGQPASPDLGEGAGPTVVTLNDRDGLNLERPHIPEADMGMDILDQLEADAAESAPSSSLKKRGRPSLSVSATPAKSVASKTPRKTPQSAKSTAAPKSAGRSTGKRKAAELEPEENEPEGTPVAKRDRPGRPAKAAGASTSARLAAKAANKPTRGRPKATGAVKKAGRAKKETNDEVPAEEYEVEEIVESMIDADTMEHMYLVKWKNYPASDNTWEPKKNFKGSLDIVRKFDAAKKKAETAEAAKKVSAKKTAGSGEKKAAVGRKPKAVKVVKAAKATKAAKAVKKAPGRPGRPRRARA